jgi:hypothetical protein
MGTQLPRALIEVGYDDALTEQLGSPPNPPCKRYMNVSLTAATTRRYRVQLQSPATK